MTRLEHFRQKYTWAWELVQAELPSAEITDQVRDYGHAYDLTASIGNGADRLRFRFNLEADRESGLVTMSLDELREHLVAAKRQTQIALSNIAKQQADTYEARYIPLSDTDNKDG